MAISRNNGASDASAGKAVAAGEGDGAGDGVEGADGGVTAVASRRASSTLSGS